MGKWWEIVSSISTAVMALVTLLIVFFTYQTVQFNQQLIAEPRVKIERPKDIVNIKDVTRVVGDNDFCGPRGFDLTDFSQQRVLQFEVANESKITAPKVIIFLKAVHAPATALTGVMVEQIHGDTLIGTFKCGELGIDREKLNQRVPQTYELTVQPLASKDSLEDLRVSVSYAQMRGVTGEILASIYVSAVPLGSRFAESGDQKILPIGR